MALNKPMSTVESVVISVEATPPTINNLSRKHWGWRVNQKALWMQLISVGFDRWKDCQMLRGWAADGVRVRVEITVHHNREFDPDNLFSTGKIILDSLKSLGFITDDKSKHIEFHAAQEKSKKPRTVIRITPLGGAHVPSKT